MAATDIQGPETGSLMNEKKRPGFLLIIVGVLIFLLVVAVGGFLGYTQLPKTVDGLAGNAVVEKKVVRLETKGVIALEPFLVNLADSDEIRFLRAEFRLGMVDVVKVALDPAGKEIAQIRDSILRLLGSKTSDEIITTEGKEILCEEIRVLVNERYTQNRVAEVLLVDFIIQY